MRLKTLACSLVTLALLWRATVGRAQSPNRITILYDAIGRNADVQLDWGFSAPVEYGGKRIVIDTGNSADILAQNVKALGIDFRRFDFAVISHRHGDHTSGLSFLLSANPEVRTYTPSDEYFGGPTPSQFYRRGVESLPPHMRYFGGLPPQDVPHGTACRGAKFIQLDALTEISPGIFVDPTVSRTPATLEFHELSLSLRTPQGQVLVAGCSHAGIEKVLDAAMAVDKHVHLILGGLHLVTTAEPEIKRIAVALREKWNVYGIAPGHSTGEPAFAVLQKAFGNRYVYAGLGTAIELR